MSSSIPLERLKEEHREIEEQLRQLQDRKENVDEKFSSILEEEERLVEEMRKCRDPYEYSKMDIRVSRVSRSRREVQSEKEEIERKIRGYKEELDRVRKRIEYLKPRS